MTITEFAIRFLELVQYARHIVPTERDHSKWFCTRLMELLYTVVVVKIEDFKTFSYAIDYACSIEDRRRSKRFSGSKRVEGGSNKPCRRSSFSGPPRKKKRFQGRSHLIPLLLGLLAQSTSGVASTRLEQRIVAPTSQRDSSMVHSG